jgi:transcriptional regulator with PAS, ATPase and Fis domain
MRNKCCKLCMAKSPATALHRASSQANQPFVAINCAAIPETLIESELFGYRGGSFTGAPLARQCPAAAHTGSVGV